MYEPHRCAQRLLREAYAQLMPETRRRLVAEHQVLSSREGACAEGTERKRA
jgi:hypothetical protein